ALFHPNQAAFFPIRKMVGGMYARELGFVPRIAGITSPFLRFEWAYMWDSTFSNLAGTQFENHDDLRAAVSMEFGIPIRWLNPDQLFKLTGQYYVRHITDIDPGEDKRISSTEGPVQKYNHMTSVSVNTNFWASRIVPTLAWNHDWTNRGYILKPIVSYAYSNHWMFTLSGTLFGGRKQGQSYEVYDHKDFVSFKVQYKF
ncbi:MAG: hypothetical protein KJP07_20415, partial [Desulfatitalea sp.]|nr:hypothetical protein [Desulfatitalea sp.]